MTKKALTTAEDLQEEPMMTMKELTFFLNLSRTKIWNMIKEDNLPAFKFGGDYRFHKSEILVWMEGFRHNPDDKEVKPKTKKKKKKEKTNE